MPEQLQCLCSGAREPGNEAGNKAGYEATYFSFKAHQHTWGHVHTLRKVT